MKYFAEAESIPVRENMRVLFVTLTSTMDGLLILQFQFHFSSLLFLECSVLYTSGFWEKSLLRGHESQSILFGEIEYNF